MKLFVQQLGLIILFISTATLAAQDNVQTVGELPDDVFETSGLIYFNGNLITHNDSGNEAVLYELDTLTLSIQRRVNVTNIQNIDWEAISQDDEYIYIGDFGNNVGTRTDLAVHRILKEEYLSSNTVTATTINFSYEDQQVYESNGNSDWDAEAFFVIDDRIVVLTKQWQSQGSVAYEFSKFPGTYTASIVGNIEEVGLITDATYDAESNRLVVIGYSSILSPFVGVIEHLNFNAVFEGYAQQSLGLNFIQAEGLTQTGSSSYFFSSEYYSRQTPTIESPSRLYSFQIPDVVPEAPEEPENPEETETPETPENPIESELPNNVAVEDRLIIYRDELSHIYYYTITTDKSIFGQVIYDLTGKQVWQNSGEIKKKGAISNHLESSVYYLALFLEDRVISKSFAVY
ncbi:T9SS C-terminal target domain-containing protein [Maribacter sp. 1_MG-2023]|uniref:T9SS C-terminal target domain-containing protein n=1 Tax=Maribacter sp. 1_MG-2023 TaxID=3062677 RepID=UPI0026E163D9|nr:T9SS C-terminal target domain-containing protein [Maribacter sp. 1_MG-2023]MDO6473659.1 T9SS C-terminal target domain-containing protein [Maribacter sp. 1_MG-2023]